MIFKRSKTVTVEVLGRTWKFNRPPGSVVLGWAPRVAELSRNEQKAGQVFPISPDDYLEMLSEIAEWVRDIDGEAADAVTAAELDDALLCSEGLQVWISFFTSLNASQEDLGKLERRSESDSLKTTPVEQSTTVDPAGETELRH
tara:strand:+ start:705 stop:1136 length:432 start_codon:yes stop_codon:yes gene_type:complete